LAGLQFDENIGEAISAMKEELSSRNELTYLMATAITGEEQNFKLSLDSVMDASSYFLNDFVQSTLVEHGVKAKFTYGLQSRDSVVYLSSSEQFDDSGETLSYPIVLSGYLTEYSGKDLILEIRFKNVNRYLLSQLNGLTIPSMIFILIIILILIWVFKAFYIQRNLITNTNEFINNLTHELKTPVFTMGVASKILEDKIEGDAKEVIALMRSQLDRMKTQIDKVLELEIIEGKKDVLEIEKFDLVSIVKEIGSDFGRLITLEGGEFSMDIPNESCTILGDKYHLNNAVNSLLENAKKYSGQKVNIKLQVFRRGNKVYVKVSDQGIGMSREAQQKIFDKYYRVSHGDLHEVKGYGLGLHYVKRIVNLHKGKIEVESEQGRGSDFTMTLPVYE